MTTTIAAVMIKTFVKEKRLAIEFVCGLALGVAAGDSIGVEVTDDVGMGLDVEGGIVGLLYEFEIGGRS